MNKLITILAAIVLAVSLRAPAAEPLRLDSGKLALRFDASATLSAIENKLTGESYSLCGDAFAVQTDVAGLDFADAKLVSLARRSESLDACYRTGSMTIEVSYTLGRDRHFAEKRVTLTSQRDCGLKKVTLSRPTFAADGLKVVAYRYPQFGRSPGTEPICTCFGRTAKGGFFTGVEMPFDASSLHGRQVVLAYAPSLKVKTGEKLVCEPVYFGVYQRHPADAEPASPPPVRGPGQKPPAASAEVLPLPSESEAMVALTSAVLGPPRHGLVPMACGWHCEMEQHTYANATAVEQDMRSLDFIAQCGIDWLSDSHPWGGETEKMNALGADQKYVPGPLVEKFLDHARRRGVKVVMWPTMNHTHPWWGKGAPFRADKPQWLLTPKTLDGKPNIIKAKAGKANCLANTPFFNWLSRINDDGLAAGRYESWAMDGSFFGDGGWFTTIIPVDCASDGHDHLPGDSNYACQRALDRLIAGVRQRYPRMYIFMCRPPMDLGVWSLRDVDACFTLLESGTPPANIAAGDEIRKWSRVRVHHHFFPHYLDQPLLFPSRANRHASPNWPSGKLDYILLSALSSAPNQLFYLPTKTGIPEPDKAEIRKWLDWGRRNIAFLQVRRDLPDWPAPGKVDGSAHLVGDTGLVFLFNGNPSPMAGRFALTESSIGLKRDGLFAVTQEYPESSRRTQARSGETVRWEVPPQSALILKIEPAAK